MELLFHVPGILRRQIEAPREWLTEGQRMDEGAGVARVDREDIGPARIGDAIAADAVHRFGRLALVGDRLRGQRLTRHVVQAHLVMVGIAHLLDQVEVLAVAAHGVEAEVALELHGPEGVRQRAGADQEAARAAALTR